MIQLILDIFLTLVSTLVQIISYPINVLLTEFFPSFTNTIASVNSTLNTIFNTITWAIGIVPSAIIDVLLFIIVVEIAKHTIFLSTHILLRLWNIFQKVKFW